MDFPVEDVDAEACRVSNAIRGLFSHKGMKGRIFSHRTIVCAQEVPEVPRAKPTSVRFFPFGLALSLLTFIKCKNALESHGSQSCTKLYRRLINISPVRGDGGLASRCLPRSSEVLWFEIWSSLGFDHDMGTVVFHSSGFHSQYGRELEAMSGDFCLIMPGTVGSHVATPT